MTTQDIYWLAGLLEGEGCFGKSGKSSTPVIQCTMTDEDVVRRAHTTLKTTTSIYSRKRNSTLKQIYGIRICGKLAAGWMMTLYPLMGQRRQARIREILTGWRNAKYRQRNLGIPSMVNGKQTPEYRRAYKALRKQEKE